MPGPHVPPCACSVVPAYDAAVSLDEAPSVGEVDLICLDIYAVDRTLSVRNVLIELSAPWTFDLIRISQTKRYE